jgi:hypothetical protein
MSTITNWLISREVAGNLQFSAMDSNCCILVSVAHLLLAIAGSCVDAILP